MSRYILTRVNLAKAASPNPPSQAKFSSHAKIHSSVTFCKQNFYAFLDLSDICTLADLIFEGSCSFIVSKMIHRRFLSEVEYSPTVCPADFENV
jgi:hypothetical protein